MKYSWTKLDRYARCPWAYNQKYLMKVPCEEFPGQITGKENHGNIESYLNRLIHLGIQTDYSWAAAQKCFSKSAQEVWEEFYNYFALPTFLQEPGVERKLAFNRSWEPCDFDAPEAFFRMVIDFHFRQNTLAVVKDWKSTWRMPKDLEDELQLFIYAWGVIRALYPDAQEVLMELFFLRYGKPRQLLINAADLKGIPQLLERRIAEIEADKEFKPRRSSFCGPCGVTAYCPAIADALIPKEFTAPSNPEEARKIAEEVLSLSTVMEGLTEHLRTWVENNGPISVGDMVYGPGFSDNLDPEPVVTELLRDPQIKRTDIWPLISIKKTPTKSFLKKLKKWDLLKKVFALTKGDPSMRFAFRKVEKKKASKQGELHPVEEKQAA